MKYFVLLAVIANARELSHKEKLNLAVVNKEGTVVYPARVMAQNSKDINQMETMSRALDLKLSEMEELNLRDPEVWSKYAKTRDAARTASVELEALRQKQYALEEVYVDAERKLSQPPREPGLLLSKPGDVALLQEGEEADDEGEGPSKEELEAQAKKKEHFKMVAENFQDAVEEKLAESPGESEQEAEQEVEEESTEAWDAKDDGSLKKGQALLEEEQKEAEEEKKPILDEEDEDQDHYFRDDDDSIDQDDNSKEVSSADEQHDQSKKQSALLESESKVENSLVASEAEYAMSLYLAEQGLSMEEIADELHPVDESLVLEKAKLSQAQLEEASLKQEQKRRAIVQEETAAKNLKLLNIPQNLKIKTQVDKEAEWWTEFERMEKVEQKYSDTVPMECLQTPDEKKVVNNPDLELVSITYINLENSEKRREEIEKQLEPLTAYKVERFAASNATDADQEHIMAISHKGFLPRAISGGIKPTTTASYLSHAKLLKKISMDKTKFNNGVYIVLEDDSRFKSENINQDIEEIMCELKALPKDWDIYKFGYYDSSGAGCHNADAAGDYSCHLTRKSHQYMGSQAYAITPKGAKQMLAHLYDMPVYDIDAVMMPGQTWEDHPGLGTEIDANYYVSKYSHVRHDQKFGTDWTQRRAPMGPAGSRQVYHPRYRPPKAEREEDTLALEKLAGATEAKFLFECDTENKPALCREEEQQNTAEDGRESSFAAYARFARSFLQTGKMPWEVGSKSLMEMSKSHMAALV